MVSTLSQSDEAQLAQTIEMFEVITQSQPLDYQSLEILKEAYSKLGREKDALSTSKRIAQAYVQLGQLSSAILEYETILQRCPDDPDIQAALSEIENKAGNFPMDVPDLSGGKSNGGFKAKSNNRALPTDFDDGRKMLQKVFVESRVISAGDFDLCYTAPDLSGPPRGVVEPFIQVLSEKGILPAERSLKLLVDHSRQPYLPLVGYDVDIDLARSFPAETCQRWCILPFDRMSKLTFVATANPFNEQAAKELSEATGNRLLWYLVSPSELVKNVRKAFR